MTSAVERRIALGDPSRRLRRSLGPTAWAVLEELLTEAVNADVLDTNVRRIAANVGLSKDTTARALNRLIAAGLVTRAMRERTASGALASMTYTIRVNRLDDVLVATSATAVERHPRSTPARAQAAERVEPAQSSLFELDGTPA